MRSDEEGRAARNFLSFCFLSYSGGLPTRKKKQVDREDLSRPFWVDMTPAFFTKLREAAHELGMSQKELVSKAVNDFIRESKKGAQRVNLPATLEQEELIRRTQQQFGALRWASVKKADRSALMKKAAQTRWNKKPSD